MGDTVNQRVDIADVTGSTAEKGEVRVNLGYSDDGTGISKDSPAWGWDGFISRPNDPDEDGAALAFYIQDANEKFVVSMKDNRYVDNVGTMEPGDRAIVTNGPARFFMKQQEDRVLIYSENGKVTMPTPDGERGLMMMVDIDGVNGVLRLMNGNTYIEMTDESIIMGKNGGGGLIIDENGVTVHGKQFWAATKSGALGSLTPYPSPAAPPVGATSILLGPTGVAGLPSQNWSVVP